MLTLNNYGRPVIRMSHWISEQAWNQIQANCDLEVSSLSARFLKCKVNKLEP